MCFDAADEGNGKATDDPNKESRGRFDRVGKVSRCFRVSRKDGFRAGYTSLTAVHYTHGVRWQKIETVTGPFLETADYLSTRRKSSDRLPKRQSIDRPTDQPTCVYSLPIPRQRFRELRDSHDKAMEDMAAAVEAKERAHVEAMNDLERKFLTEKGNLQKVILYIVL